MGVIEESHSYRNLGKVHLAVLTLMNKAILKVAVTATPVFTSTRVSRIRIPMREIHLNLFTDRRTSWHKVA